jgi:hypothetical protein
MLPGPPAYQLLVQARVINSSSSSSQRSLDIRHLFVFESASIHFQKQICFVFVQPPAAFFLAICFQFVQLLARHQPQGLSWSGVVVDTVNMSRYVHSWMILRESWYFPALEHTPLCLGTLPWNTLLYISRPYRYKYQCRGSGLVPRCSSHLSDSWLALSVYHWWICLHSCSHFRTRFLQTLLHSVSLNVRLGLGHTGDGWVID